MSNVIKMPPLANKTVTSLSEAILQIHGDSRWLRENTCYGSRDIVERARLEYGISTSIKDVQQVKRRLIEEGSLDATNGLGGGGCRTPGSYRIRIVSLPALAVS